MKYFWAFQVVLVVKTLPVNAGDVRDMGFDPGVRKIPWMRAWQPASVFLPEESHRQEEPGRLYCIRSQRVGQDWRDLAYMHAWNILTSSAIWYKYVWIYPDLVDCSISHWIGLLILTSCFSERVVSYFSWWNQSWVFIGRTDTETPILRPPDAKN